VLPTEKTITGNI